MASFRRNLNKLIIPFAGTVMMAAPHAWADCTGKTPVDFSFTGSPQTFVVPAGVTTVYIEAFGAEGGSATQNAAFCPLLNGGQGGQVTGDLAVTPGETLTIFVGGKGNAGASGGFNGGGLACSDATTCATGGGASDVRKAPAGLADRRAVGGGGGGTEWTGFCSPTYHGGNAGGLTGSIGCGDSGCANPSNGSGGTPAAGGLGSPAYFGFPAGANGALGVGGASFSIHSGGGGGGLFGGGGASADGSGGGGSSYTGGLTGSTNTPGVRRGNGTVRICHGGVGGGGGGGGGSCDLTPIEAKLDADARWVDEAEAAAAFGAIEAKLDTDARWVDESELAAAIAGAVASVVSEINANEAKIDLLEAKLDGGSFGDIIALQCTILDQILTPNGLRCTDTALCGYGSWPDGLEGSPSPASCEGTVTPFTGSRGTPDGQAILSLEELVRQADLLAAQGKHAESFSRLREALITLQEK